MKADLSGWEGGWAEVEGGGDWVLGPEEGGVGGARLQHGEATAQALHTHTANVEDPDPGSGAFLTPRSGIRDGKKIILVLWEFVTELRIRIRINLNCWIRIRVQIADPDPDQGGQKWPTKIEKSTEILCIEVLDVLFWGLKASSVAWAFFIEV